MADFYFDSITGNDSTGNGTHSNPWATYEGRFSSTTFADRCFFRRGTTQVITTLFRVPRIYMGAYGEGPRPRFIYAGTPWANMLNGAGLSNVTLESLDFDMAGNPWSSIYIACQGSINVTGWRIRDCLFRGSSQRSGVSVVRENTSTASISDILFEDSYFFNNAEHGTIVIGASDVRYKRSYAWGNGYANVTGGHGFSSRWLRSDVNSGWSLVSGNIYKRSLTAAEQVHGVKYVQSPIANRNRLVENTVTPTSLLLDQFGNSNGELFINIGQNPNGVNIRYAWGRASNLLWEDCAAWDNIDFVSAPFQEGHGFAFDDFVENSIIRRCRSFFNQGSGYSLNRGDNNRIQHSIGYSNGGPAIICNTSNNSEIDRCYFSGNSKGNPRNAIPPINNEMYFSPQASALITKTYARSNRADAQWVIRDDIFSNISVIDSILLGASSPMRTGIPITT